MAYSQAMSMDPQLDLQSHEGLDKILFSKPVVISTNKLWSFLKKIRLSRDVSQLKSFSDGRMCQSHTLIIIIK
jgi:hypothetical protein